MANSKNNKDKKPLVVYEHNRELIISEWQSGVLVPLLRLTYGAVTQAQLAYYEANLKGRIKQIEADMILKYYYGLD